MFEQMQQNVKNADDKIEYTPADFANFLGITYIISPAFLFTSLLFS